MRVIEGRVYFRYGGFLFQWYRMKRFHDSILMIQVRNIVIVLLEFRLQSSDYGLRRGVLQWVAFPTYLRA